MTQQEIIDSAIAAYESGEWEQWIMWLREQGVREVVPGSEHVLYRQTWEPVHLTDCTGSGSVFPWNLLRNNASATSITVQSKLEPVTAIKTENVAWEDE